MFRRALYLPECDLSFLNVRIRDSRKIEAARVKKYIYNSAIIMPVKSETTGERSSL